MRSSKIDEFFAAPAFAVVGASDDARKFGHKVYMHYLRNNRKAYPVNPRCPEIEGNVVYPTLESLPEPVEAVSIITPPAVTEKIVDEALKLGIKNIWMQPGAESMPAVRKAEEAGVNVIYGGPCVLIEL